jgi:hypothetical protein
MSEDDVGLTAAHDLIHAHENCSRTSLNKWRSILNRFITQMNRKWNNGDFRPAMKAYIHSKDLDPELAEGKLLYMDLVPKIVRTLLEAKQFCFAQ